MYKRQGPYAMHFDSSILTTLLTDIRQNKVPQVAQVKETVGRITNDPVLEDEGVRDQASGEVQDTVGKVQRKVGEAVENVGKKLKH